MDPRISAVLARFGLPSDRLPSSDELDALGDDRFDQLSKAMRSIDAADQIAAIAAAATPAPSPKATPRPTRPAGRINIPPAARTASNAVTASGAKVTDADALIDAITAAAGALGNAPGINRVMAVRSTVPTDRMLGVDPITNEKVMASTLSTSALVASGGICAPSSIDYTVPGFASTARPVADALPTYGAPRGGVKLRQAITIASVASGSVVWSEVNDQSPSAPATKPTVSPACPTVVETRVDAITAGLKLGNFRTQFDPEYVQAALDALAAAQARTAEQRLLALMEAGSTSLAVGQLLGTSRDVLAGLDRAAAAMRSRHRLPDGLALRFIAPRWLRDQVRADLTRELPGSSQERLAVADAEIDQFFAARNIAPVWSLDYQVFSAQGGGALQGWPSTVNTLLFPEGSWVHLDGGTLDLGMVRDSTLISTNDAIVFSETFESVAYRGVESFRLTFDTCPSGTVSATTAINPCTTGS